MRFIHTSNIHIGMSPDPDKPWSESRSDDLRKTFEDIINLCKNESIDLLMISGNLFNYQPTTEDLTYVDRLFKTIPDTNVLIVAGSSDHIKSNSPILNYVFSDNVHYFLSSAPDTYYIKDKKICIHGISCFSLEDPSTVINSITSDNDNNTHILMFHGSDSRHLPCDINKLAEKNFSYVALGLSHNFQEVVRNKIYYSGSPEPLDQNDEGNHGVIYGEINNKTHEITKIEFVKTAKLSYIPIKIKINSKTSESDVVELVDREVLRQGNNNIYKIILEGMRDPDIEFDSDIFNKSIKIASFEDQSNPKYDFIKLSSEHPQDMIGAFIRKMTLTNNNPSDIEKNALYYGTQALLKSTEKD